MASVTKPLLLDDTGKDIIDALDGLNDVLEKKQQKATNQTVGLVKPDGTSITITPDGTISTAGQLVPVPVVSQAEFTYNGSEQGIVFSSLATDAVLITGTSATNAGSYTCTVTLKNPSAHWTDGTKAPKLFPWIIQKATGSITVDQDTISLDTTTSTATVAVTIVGDGGAEFASSDSTVASVSPATLSATGTITITAHTSGDATITATLLAGTNYTGDSKTIAVDCSMVPMKTFAAATDAEIAQMVAAADAGQIDLYEDCGWRVGQEHVTNISAIASSGTYDGVSWSVYENQPAQQITLVLMHRGLYELVSPVLDKQGNERTVCSFVVGVKDCLSQPGILNRDETNAGSWEAMSRRKWCDAGFKSSLSSSIRAACKLFKVTTGVCTLSPSGGDNQTITGFSALFAEKEVGGARVYGTTKEANALTQIDWYQTVSNRLKYLNNGKSKSWWFRSPAAEYGDRMCIYGWDGHFAFTYPASGDTDYMSPFCCM